MTEKSGFVSVVGGWQCQQCAAIVADPYRPPHVCTPSPLEYVTIDGRTLPVNTVPEIELATRALTEAGINSAEVWRSPHGLEWIRENGDPDAVKTGHVLLAATDSGPTEYDPKVRALAAHLNVRPDTIEKTRHSDDCFECESEPGEYRVLTSEEREKAADEALESYVDECIIEQAKASAKHARDEGLASIVDTLARYFDRAAWKRDALLSDGYGHTLSSYDGEEHEEKVGDTWYYIYRVN